MSEHDEHWITTFTGSKFHFLDPRPEEICIKDIAHALSLTCRFGGHCRWFASVAEHSVRVARLVRPSQALAALLHDAAEAYIPDIPRPIKCMTPEFKKLYIKIEEAIYKKFGVKDIDHKEIKLADDTMLATEAKLLGMNTTDWAPLPEPLHFVSGVLGWQPEVAEQIFRESFESLVRDGRF